MLGWQRCLLLLIFWLCQPLCFAGTISTNIIGDTFEYIVQSGDSLTKIGARFGIPAKALASDNGLDLNKKLTPSQKLSINNRHIVPLMLTGDLLINIPQRMIYIFENGELIAGYPVGLGKPTWQTPSGGFTINNKVIDKTWLVPISIQEEMRHEGKVVKTNVPPGPDNPLGKYWLGLSLSGIGIHGTISPASIYQFQSHGCIRMQADDIEALFMNTEIGIMGEIIYEPLLLAELDGRIYLEVHPDIYQYGDISLHALEKIAQESMLTEHIDWNRARNVLMLQDGIAKDVTLSTEAEINYSNGN